MSNEPQMGCARPTGGPVGEQSNESTQPIEDTKKEVKTMIEVGKKAPDFVAPAYYKGEFTNIKLSDYLGRWVVLCFYPGDFTFV